MCGRYAMFAPPDEVARVFRLPLDEVHRIFDFGPRYNVAPSDTVAAVRLRSDGAGREPARLRWGLVPHWAHNGDVAARTINARAETVADKPAFRDPFRERRCLVLTNGFYEWQRLPGRKQPHFICLPNQELFAFAGLWDRWQGGGGEIESCTIVTTDANRTLKPIHDRMPVILDPENYDLWLDVKLGDLREPLRLLRPYPDDRLMSYPVSTLVNKPANDVPECVRPMQPSHPDLFQG
ncbi:MAG: SOS response-associated peptidase [Gemmatimonadota bacterium]|nr:MAG: SOS response-associated peptidase [Gemmatimonadota bacterium]